MAESVDALVSNTSGATRAGSTPALGTKLEGEGAVTQRVAAHFYRMLVKIWLISASLNGVYSR